MDKKFLYEMLKTASVSGHEIALQKKVIQHMKMCIRDRYMIGTADQYVVIDKMLDIAGNSTAVGIKWALQSFMEVPLFLFSAKILARFQTKTLLYFGTLMYGIKFLLYGISFQPWMIILTAALQLVTLPDVYKRQADHPRIQ